MYDFAFVVVSYNQERYVIQHLNSIKYQINNYGNGKTMQLVFSDDASKDRTVDIAEEWISANKSLFSDIVIIRRKENIGTIRNLHNAINLTNAKRYKELACDDLYYKNNIFEAANIADIVLTPIISFWDDGKIEHKIADDYCTILRRSGDKKKILKEMLKYNQCIPSPGVFMDKKFWVDKGFSDYMMQFKYIEDIPEWDYIFSGKYNEEFTVRVVNKPYVLYRRSVGISQNIVRSNDNPIDREYSKIRELIPSREDKKPKWLNYYRVKHYIDIHFLNSFWLKEQIRIGEMDDWENGINNVEEYLRSIIYVQK